MCMFSRFPIYVVIYLFIRSDAIKSRLYISFAALLSRLGPAFVKFGQMLSTRPDIIGSSGAEYLTVLQDKMNSFSFRKVKKILHREFKNMDFIETIEETPVSAASVSQVHRARLATGEDVAVKVLRPNIKRVFASNISTLRAMVKFASIFLHKTTGERLLEVVSLLENITRNELNLRMEAAAADQIRENCSEHKRILHIPIVYWEHTTNHVLVMEWVEGVSLNNKAEIEKLGLDVKRITRNLAIIFFQQAYCDGFFHADLHGGNIMVTSNYKIILVDFGIVCSLSDKDRIFVAQTLYFFLKKDYEKVAMLHREMKLLPESQDIKLFTLACRSIGKQVIGKQTKNVSAAKLLKYLFEISETFDIQIQVQLTLLQKTLVMIEGVGFLLYPDVNMWELAEPWIKEWVAKSRSKVAILKKSKEIVCSLPGESRKMASKLAKIVDKIEEKLLQ